MKIAVSRSVRLQFLRVAMYERGKTFSPWPRKQILDGNFAKQNMVQWMLFPEYL